MSEINTFADDYNQAKEYLLDFIDRHELPRYPTIALSILTMTIITITALIMLMYVWCVCIHRCFLNPIIRPFLRTPDSDALDRYLIYLHSQRDSIVDELVNSVDSNVIGINDINPYEENFDSIGGHKAIYLRVLNNLTNQEEFPRTHRLLRSSQFRLGTVALLYLAPNTTIPKHRGTYEGIIRCHIPLVIPDGDLGIKIYGKNGATYDWSHPFSFEDTDYHEYWNYTTDNVILMILDIVKTVPFPLNIVNDMFFNRYSTKACKKSIKLF